ncbi:MAG: YbjN domain-containing protein [Actinomycetaceae bacterium]|nr:YbjN domain-containing protein [Actinomycetaceae bacterium]
MEHVPWFRQVAPEDAVAPVTVERLTQLVSQGGWDVGPVEGTETQIVASRGGRDIFIEVFDDGQFLALDHYGTARYPADRVNEFIVNMNHINAQLEVHHTARLLPAYADDSHICVRAVSRFLAGAGMSDAQILAHVEMAASACHAFVEQFEHLTDGTAGDQTSTPPDDQTDGPAGHSTGTPDGRQADGPADA